MMGFSLKKCVATYNARVKLNKRVGHPRCSANASQAISCSGHHYPVVFRLLLYGRETSFPSHSETFGSYAVIQRCHYHKRENVMQYLRKSKQDHYQWRINRAYHSDDYDEARRLLKEIITDLKSDNLGASRSMAEGLEETLTLHRLGLIADFRRSFQQIKLKI